MSRGRRSPPRRRAAARRSPTGRRPAKRGRSPKRGRSAKRRRGAARRRRGSARPLLLAVLGIGIVAFAISRIDFGEAIKEITLPLRHDDIIRQEADDEDIALVEGQEISLPATDPALLAAVIYTESRFRDQTSSAGARGLMQITPATADTIEGISGGETFVYEDLSDPDLNIRYGSFFLRYLLYLFGNNEVAALAGYNAGAENAKAWGGAEMDIGDIKFPETHDYVESVLQKRDEYRKNYAAELGLD